MDKFYLKKAEVVKAVGLGYTSIWKLEREGKFPARKQLSPGRVAWVRAEVEEWVRNRPTVSAQAA